MRFLLLSLCLVATLALFPTGLAAQWNPGGWYVGGGGGSGTSVAYPTGLTPIPLSPPLYKNLSNDRTSYQVFGGYETSWHFSIESGFARYREIHEYGFGSGIGGVCSIDVLSPCNGTFRQNVTENGIKTSIRGALPFGDRYAVTGTAGFAALHFTESTTQAVTFNSSDMWKSRALLGAGGRHKIADRFVLRADWEWFPETTHGFYGGFEWRIR